MSNDTEQEETAIESLANDLINGNLSDAKKKARSFGAHDICRGFIELGWTTGKARAAAIYLKDPDQESFQAYCDAV
jgi:hypothetical protein